MLVRSNTQDASRMGGMNIHSDQVPIQILDSKSIVLRIRLALKISFPTNVFEHGSQININRFYQKIQYDATLTLIFILNLVFITSISQNLSVAGSQSGEHSSLAPSNITMDSHHFLWVDQLFLWPFSIANCSKLPKGSPITGSFDRSLLVAEGVSHGHVQEWRLVAGRKFLDDFRGHIPEIRTFQGLPNPDFSLGQPLSSFTVFNL